MVTMALIHSEHHCGSYEAQAVTWQWQQRTMPITVGGCLELNSRIDQILREDRLEVLN